MVRWCWVNFQCGGSYNLDFSRARAYCTCSRCGWGLVWTFLLSSILSLLFLPLFWETARYRLKYCLEGPLKTKQPTKPTLESSTQVSARANFKVTLIHGTFGLRRPSRLSFHFHSFSKFRILNNEFVAHRWMDG